VLPGHLELAPEVKGGEAAVRHEALHQGGGLVTVRPRREREEALQVGRQGRIAERYAVLKPEGAQHDVIRGPHAEPGQAQQGSLGPRGRPAGQRSEGKVVFSDRPRSIQEGTCPGARQPRLQQVRHAQGGDRLR